MDDPEEDIPLSHLITRLTDNPLTQDAYLDIETAIPIEDDSDDWEEAIIAHHTEQPKLDQPDSEEGTEQTEPEPEPELTYREMLQMTTRIRNSALQKNIPLLLTRSQEL